MTDGHDDEPAGGADPDPATADAETAADDGTTGPDDGDPTPASRAETGAADPAGDDRAVTAEAFYDAVEEAGRPVVTAREIARSLDVSQARATEELADLAVADDLPVEADPVVYFPEDISELASRERVVPFPDRREVVVHHPEQYTLAQISQFAHLVTASGEGGYVYEIRDADVWAAPHDDLGELLAAVRRVLGEWPSLEEFVESQYERARKFQLRSEDDYTVLEATSEDLMGNVAQQKLDDDLIRGLISETEAWVAEDREAEIKQALYDAGYPVRDDRELDEGDDLPLDLRLELREYQRDWVDRFLDQGAGVLVGPPGSGKTVATMGIMDELEGETLVLVPSRELAGQWSEELLEETTLDPDQVGEYHGGAKDLRPVTVATYQTAGMDRHRKLFDARRWGLIVYDECLAVETTVETPDGETTFADLDDRYGLDDGWNDVDLRVRTFVPGDGYAWTDVSGLYRTETTVERVETDAGETIRATPDHTHLVFDPAVGRLEARTGVEEGDFLVEPTGSPSGDDRPGRIVGSKDNDLPGFELGEGIDSGRPGGATTVPGEVAGLRVLEVTDVTTEGVETAYDFETATGTFLADGLLTHNCQRIPSPVFRRSADLQSKHRLGLSGAPVREDDRESEIFTLVGPPIGTDWTALFEAGFVAEPEVEIRYVPWADEEKKDEYAAASGHERRQVAASNPAKVREIRRITDSRPDAKALVFVDYLDQGEAIAEALDVPFVSGETRHARRARLFDEFRRGERELLVLSRVGDEGIDLPDAELAVVASGLGGSRRQGTQRAGRTMRPVGRAEMYVLATRGTEEEEFARQRMRHLAGKGVTIRESQVE